MTRLFLRSARAAAAIVVIVFAAASAVGAQTDTSEPDTSDAVTTVAPAPNATTTTTIACPVFAGPDAQFLGTATAVADEAVRFHVDKVEAGEIAAGDVDVDYPDDARFFKVGTQYRVPVLRDTESDRFVSKVRPVAPDRGGVVAACAKKDPVLTTLASGKPIDTGVFSGLHGKGGRVARSFLIPTLAVLGVLIVLVALKHAVTWTFNRLAHHSEP